VPAPSSLSDRLLRNDLGTKADEPLRLRLKIAGAKIEVNPVLAVLVLGDLLQKNLRARTICWQQALIEASGDAVPDIPECAGPEFC